MIFNHVLSTPEPSALNNFVPNVTNVNLTSTTASNVINVPGHPVKYAVNSIPSVQKRQPHHAAKSCQPATITSSNIVQPIRKEPGPSLTNVPKLLLPVKPTPPVVSPTKKESTPVEENSRGRSDHEYSNSNLKRPASETKSPNISPSRKTKKQQAEAISKSYC